MPQDAFTLKYLCEELNGTFAGGKVNRIMQPNNDEVVLTVYTGKRTERLLLDVNPAAPRIGVLRADKESPLTAPNFCMLLRKHLAAATLDGIFLVGFDRIVRIDFTASGEFFDSVKKCLFIELMGRYSNIVLTEDGKILGGNRGINLFDVTRPLIVGKEYLFPPVGEKKEPTDPSLKGYFAAFGGGDLADYILKGVQGVAASTVNQMLYDYKRKKGLEDAALIQKFPLLAEDFFDFSVNFLYSARLKPCVVKKEGVIKDVCLFPYFDAEGDITFFDSLCAAEDYFYTEKNKLKIFTAKKERLKSVLNAAVKKAKKRLAAINAKEKDAERAEENRIYGELILSNIYKIKEGDAVLAAENYYDGNKTVEIPLDPRFSPSKNAEAYYKKYNKQKRTLSALAPQKDLAEKELFYLESVTDELSLAENVEETEYIYSEAEAYGLIKEAPCGKKKKAETTFCRTYAADGFKVKVGRNNVENDKLTATAKPESMWLHAKDYHSSHVVIEYGGKPFTEKAILIAAEICAYYSKGRAGGKTEIVYTLKKNVKKPPKSKAGFCIYDNFKSITVNASAHTEILNSD